MHADPAFILFNNPRIHVIRLILIGFIASVVLGAFAG